MLEVSQKEVSQKIEDLMVARNPRGMKTLQAALTPGYFFRAATLIDQAVNSAAGPILIGTGFPVDSTFETDGPLGAIALYRAIQKLGGSPVLVCGDPLAERLKSDFRVYQITVADNANREHEARQGLQKLSPSLVVSIERPGLNAEGNYCNMRGENISRRCASFDEFLNLASCPTIGIGDGGNEIGMGNVVEALAALNITPSITQCDELVIADVSNWAAHGLIAMLSYFKNDDMLADWNNLELLHYLSSLGSVDGVSRENTLTEDSLDSTVSEEVILSLRKISGFC